MFRYRLRSLLIVLALGPVAIAALVWGWDDFWDLWWVQIIRGDIPFSDP